MYARLMRLYPPSFRARFGDEILQFVRTEAAQGRRLSFMRTLADLFPSAVGQRWEAREMKKSWWVVGMGVLIAFVFTRLVIGSGFTLRTLLIMSIEAAAVGLIVGAAALLGRRVRGAEFDYAVRKFRWWWVPAALCGAAEAILVTGQVIRDPKATNVVAAFAIGGFAALVFAGMWIRDRRTGNFMIAAGVVPLMMLVWFVIPPIVALLVIVMALADNVRIARPHTAV